MEKQTLSKDELIIIYSALMGFALRLGDENTRTEPLRELIRKIETMTQEA